MLIRTAISVCMLTTWTYNQCRRHVERHDAGDLHGRRLLVRARHGELVCTVRVGVDVV